MKVTEHAKKRLEERTNIKKYEWNKSASSAYKKGYRISVFSEPFYSYLKGRQLAGDRTSVKVWNNNIYIFDNRHQKLLTIYPVPEEFLPIKKFLGEQKVPCVIFVNDSWYVPIEFKSRQSAINYIKNNRSLDGLKVVVIPSRG